MTDSPASPSRTTFETPWLLRQFSRLDHVELSGVLCVVLLWAVMAFPAVGLRGTHFEEGTVVALARGAVEDGHWLTPYRYGVRFIERPVLLSWITASLGFVTGGVTIWTARIPHLLFLLGGGLMIFNLVRAQASKAAAIFGALCWFACPMVAQKFITAEPDVTMSVCLFAAFFVWWKGVAANNTTLKISPWPRWIAVGAILGLAALVKGPQPLAYVALGIGLYLVVKRRWQDLPGLIVANVIAVIPSALWYWAVMQPGDLTEWMHHSRLSEGGTGLSASVWIRDHLDFVGSLFFEWLPSSILLGPAILMAWRKPASKDNDLLLAALLYALAGSLVLVIWPGGVASRYAMPANLALAVLAGLLFEAWRISRPKLIATSLTVVTAIASYVVILGWLAMPIAPNAFRRAVIAAQQIEAARKVVPGPLYVTRNSAGYNTLIYVDGPIREITLNDFAGVPKPALAALNSEEVKALAAKPNIRVVLHGIIRDNPMNQMVEIRP